MKELLNKIQEEKSKLISERAVREKEVDEMFSRLKKVDKQLLAHIDHYDIGTATCKDVFPSLYAETFDKEASLRYDEEHGKFLSFISEIDKVRERLIKEAEEALSSVTAN